MTSPAFISALPLSSDPIAGHRSCCRVSQQTFFVTQQASRLPARPRSSSRTSVMRMTENEEDRNDTAGTVGLDAVTASVMAAMLGFGIWPVEEAEAVPEAVVQAFKSIPSSLVHPAVMWLMLAGTLYTFYLGYQSSMIRKTSGEEKKALVRAKVTDRHFQLSSFLFATTSLFTFGGMANTYTRAGKLFPGPHLYSGLGILAAMSVMSAFVPYMQKGKDWARNAHFTTAFLVTGLFLWQAKSGMDIVGKLLKW